MIKIDNDNDDDLDDLVLIVTKIITKMEIPARFRVL